MIRIPLSIGLAFTLLVCAFQGIAQEAPAVPAASEVPLQAVITGPQDIPVGRTIILDASLSRSDVEGATYQWFVEGARQPISSAVEAVYTPEQPGTVEFRLRMTATVNGQPFTSEATHTVVVFRRKVLLIADSSIPPEKLAGHQQTAGETETFLRILQVSEATPPLGTEEELTQLLSEQGGAIENADAIALWAEGITGLQALARALQGNEELLAGVRQQTIVLITRQGLTTLRRTIGGPYAILRPQQVFLTREEAIGPLLSAQSIESFVTDTERQGIDILRVTEASVRLKPWHALSWLVQSLLMHGVPSQTVILLLVLPFIATILAFFKQVVGITTFGLYTPSIIALSFLALGWKVGVVILLFILLSGYATRAFMQRWRLLYIPKVAIVITVVSITLLILTGLSAAFELTFSRETVFILLILSTLAESFLTLKTEQGWTSAIFGVAETILAALFCVFLVQWGTFQALVLAYPELILLTIVADVLLGRWTGLRIMEYFRFREVFKHLQEE